MKKNDLHRSMTVNYIFYPGIKEELEEKIKLLLKESASPRKIDSSDGTTAAPVKAIISPHAGWDHCGRIMATAYSSVAERDFDTIVILSRVHREPARTVFLPGFTSYDTPLGELDVDQEILTQLAYSSNIFKFDNIPHIEEHSLEVQLPFIKYLWPAAKIVPILTGKPLISMTNKLSASLSEVLKDKIYSALFIISSSVSSYDTVEITKAETDQFISMINNRDKWEEMPDMLNRGDIGACSADCVLAVIKTLKYDVSVEMLNEEYGQNSDPKEKRVCFGAFSMR